MKLRILSAVVALTVVLQLTGCCCWREHRCGKRLLRHGCGCQPTCCESCYTPGGEPPLSRPVQPVPAERRVQ